MEEIQAESQNETTLEDEENIEESEQNVEEIQTIDGDNAEEVVVINNQLESTALNVETDLLAQLDETQEVVSSNQVPDSDSDSTNNNTVYIRELFERKSGIFVFHYSPEQLPGLAAWKLETVQNLPHWSMDVVVYQELRQHLIEGGQRDAESEKIFSYKSLTRRVRENTCFFILCLFCFLYLYFIFYFDSFYLMA